MVLIISGNLSFLNYVTIIPFLACFDDTFLRRLLPKALVKRAEQAVQESEPSRINNTVAIALSILVVYLSIAPVLNLVSGRQLMNYSYDPFPSTPPSYVRARLYRYQFAPLRDKAWWRREPIGEWLPALSIDDTEFRRLLGAMDWLD